MPLESLSHHGDLEGSHSRPNQYFMCLCAFVLFIAMIHRGCCQSGNGSLGHTDVKLLNAPVMIQQKLKDEGALLLLMLFHLSRMLVLFGH